ncbi:hypothetical protein HanRHA438_Chr11g0529321 [Helianthus annuus]|nr:hypothetical protein HanRHA438_Chr11g0529321 [Helianthus annuus]
MVWLILYMELASINLQAMFGILQVLSRRVLLLFLPSLSHHLH